MIRINLLEHRPKPAERIQAILHPAGRTAFASRREVVIGAGFLLLAMAILAAQFLPRDEPETPADGLGILAESRAPQRKNTPPSAPSAAAPRAASEEPPPASPADRDEPSTPKPDPRPSAPVAEPDPPASGGTISALRVEAGESAAELALTASGLAAPRAFRLDNPPRLVFDFPGARLEIPPAQANRALGFPFAQRVRLAQFSVDPPIVRLVVDADRFPESAVETRGDETVIRLTEGRP